MPLPRATSEQTSLGKRQDGRPADHEVIEHANVDQCQRLLEGLGQGLVRVTGLSATGRMVMHECDVKSFL